jgi:hypothetical protein
VGLVCLGQDVGGGSGIDISVDVGGNLQDEKVTVRTRSSSHSPSQLAQEITCLMHHAPIKSHRKGRGHAVGSTRRGTCTAMGLDDQGGRGAEHANCGMRMRMGEDDAVESRLQSWSKEDSAVPIGSGSHVVDDGGGIYRVGVGVLRKHRDETVSLRTGRCAMR